MKARARTHFAEGFKVLWLNTKGLGKRIKEANRAALEAFRQPQPDDEDNNKDTKQEDGNA